MFSNASQTFPPPFHSETLHTEAGAFAPGIARPPFDVVAIAASAGGLHALTRVLAPLPADFPTPIVLVQHLRRDRPSLLAELLNRRTPLRVCQAMSGDRLRPGVVYAAPPDRHLIVNADGTLLLSDTPRIHFTRPAADPCFESVAAAYGERVLAVILTGAGRDGAVGALSVKRHGGTVLAQDPDSAHCDSMPQAVIRTGCVDFVLPLDRMAGALVTLAMIPGAASLFGVPASVRVPVASAAA